MYKKMQSWWRQQASDSKLQIGGQQIIRPAVTIFPDRQNPLCNSMNLSIINMSLQMLPPLHIRLHCFEEVSHILVDLVYSSAAVITLLCRNAL